MSLDSVQGLARALGGFTEVLVEGEELIVPQTEVTILRDLCALKCTIGHVAIRNGVVVADQSAAIEKESSAEKNRLNLELLQGGVSLTATAGDTIVVFTQDDFPNWQKGMQRLFSALGVINVSLKSGEFNGKHTIKCMVPKEVYTVPESDRPSLLEAVAEALAPKKIAVRETKVLSQDVLLGVPLPYDENKAPISFVQLASALESRCNVPLTVEYDAEEDRVTVGEHVYRISRQALKLVKEILKERKLEIRDQNYNIGMWSCGTCEWVVHKIEDGELTAT